MVEKPPANAGGTGSIPGRGRSHKLRGAKPLCHNYWACALEPGSHNWAFMLQLPQPTHPRACALQQEKRLQWEAPACWNKRKACAATKTQHSQKKIKNLKMPFILWNGGPGNCLLALLGQNEMLLTPHQFPPPPFFKNNFLWCVIFTSLWALVLTAPDQLDCPHVSGEEPRPQGPVWMPLSHFTARSSH